MLRGEFDATPDNFYANFPAGGGGNSSAATKFYISPDKSIYQKTVKDFKITPTFNNTPGNRKGDILSFQIQDAYGNIYDFDQAEETFFALDDLQPGNPLGGPIHYTYTFNSTWHLSKMTSVNDIESFEYEYKNDAVGYSPAINLAESTSITSSIQIQGNTNTCCGQGLPVTNNGNPAQTSILQRKFLSKIYYKLGNDTLEVMEFYTSDNPCSVKNNGDKKLDSLVVKRGNGTPILRYDFTYDCSTNRLTLTAVQEKSYDGSFEKEAYQFEYNFRQMPSIITTGLDHHGFYNGQTSNANLIPNIKPNCAGTTIYGGSSNRSPNESFGQAALLEKLIYPLGGWTIFTYEGHKAAGKGSCLNYDFNADPNADRLIGGMRIAEVKNYDCDGTIISKRSYKYVKEDGVKSSGLLLAEPEYFTLPTPTYKNCLIPNIGNGCNVDDYKCQRFTVFANNQSVLGAVQGTHVAYSRVEEIVESALNSTTAGKSVYHLLKLEEFGIQDYDKVSNGLLTKKEVWDAGDKKVARTEYEYSLDNNETRLSKSFFGYKPIADGEQDNKIVLCRLSNGSYDWKLITDDLMSCDTSANFFSKYTRGEKKKYEQKWVYQSKKIDSLFFYHANGTLIGEVGTVTDYIYGDTMTTQPTETIVSNSDGKQYKTISNFRNSFDNTQYPVPDDSGSFLASMQSKNMNAYPLVEAKFIDNQEVYKTKLNYKQFGGLTLPYKLYEQFPTTGDLLAEVIDDYDEVGNIVQGHRHYEHSSGNSQPTALIYSNEKSRMAAQVQNATADEVAYTSFETNQTYQGGWTVPDVATEIRFQNVARTGKGHYQPVDPNWKQSNY